MGHATRSSVVLRHLVAKHEVQIVVSGRAHDYLKRRFSNVEEIHGLQMSYQGNAVDRSATVWNFIKRLPGMLSDNFEDFIALGERFAPDVVISDFETFSYLFAKNHRLPVLSIDNMQIINRCRHDGLIDEDHRFDFKTAKALVKVKLPGCYHYLITSFFFPPPRKERTSLFPPILRRKVLEAETTQGDHLLVYQTTTTNERLLDVLSRTKIPCRVYGLNREENLGTIQLRGFSEDGFIRDLASCRGVLATGGYSLMGEAVYLRKPVLAVPLRKQFEQVLNAIYLQKLGYGAYHERLTAAAVEAFNRRIDEYGANLASYQQDGNERILAAIDRLLAEIGSGDLSYQPWF